ncbi:hypothetical protein [Krasilnikoviella flava]|uniref:Uncharacterized protein n=1 Tax=Krasilnikoviella flava TaxID=526729 RepID=A0A1T5L584_9MICO|nr:hypothetical protein [Krasilnikoviella flava]SKC71103.1 hypothetical protein SAMN04324258_2883 [Krasilnikoviella flava]
MWGWIWAGLVVGTLVGAFFLGRHLWRAGVRALREASRAGEVLGSAADRMSAAVAEAEAHRADTSPTLLDDPVLLRERVAERRRLKAERVAVRRERQAATWRRWDSEGWLAARTADKAAHADLRSRTPGRRR